MAVETRYRTRNNTQEAETYVAQNTSGEIGYRKTIVLDIGILRMFDKYTFL